MVKFIYSKIELTFLCHDLPEVELQISFCEKLWVMNLRI